MVAKRLTRLMLAASIMACSFTGCLLNSQAAHAITRVDELSDVQQSNWAYEALKNLVEKYNVIEGFPDKTFRGNKAPTRYEMAAALDATVKAMGQEIARLGAEKANKEDLAVVAKLQEEFAKELTALQARSTALEARATKIEAKNDEQDNRLAVIEKLKLYGDVSFGGFADIAGNPGSAYRDGISALGRTRVNVDYAAVDDKNGRIVGPGTVHSRLVAAFGRVAPLNDGSAANAVNTFSGISTIAQDASLYNEGIAPNQITNDPGVFGSSIIGGANLRANAYFDSAYYSQVLKITDKSDWRTTFTTIGGLMPFRDLYFKSPYYGNDNLQFENTALINNPAAFLDITAPRLAAVINQQLGKWADFRVTTDVSAIDTSNIVDGGLGFQVEANLGYNLGFIDKYLGTNNLFNLRGDVYGAYYQIHSPGTLERLTVAPVVTDSLGHGFYVGANQELYKGIGGFFTFANNDSSSLSALMTSLRTNTGQNIIWNNAGQLGFYGIKYAWTFGTEIPLRALPQFLTRGYRQRDALGLGYALLKPNPEYATTGAAIGVAAASAEQVFEGYYRAQITDGFALIPSVQLIYNRAGDKANDMDVVIGLRTSFYF